MILPNRFLSPERQQAALNAHYEAIAERTYWECEAARVKEASDAKRKADVRARAELVNHLVDPEAAQEMVLARAKFNLPVWAADRKPPARFVWMPAGEHVISAGTMSGGSWEGRVICDERAARKIEASFANLTREGWRSFIDFAHKEEGAAAWVHGFSWDPTRGILCAVEWTSAGEIAVRDRVFMSFSPTFCVDDNGRPSGLLIGHAAGALVNNPAFGLAMPAIAATRHDDAADVVHQTLISTGYRREDADRVANLISAGHSPEAVGLFIRSLN